MSLLYDADGDMLITNGNVQPATGMTVAFWFRPTDDTLRQVLMYFTSGGPDSGVVWRADQAGKYFSFFREGSTYAGVDANAADYAVYGLNKWLYLVGRADLAGSSLWMGDETTPPAAPAAYQFGGPFTGIAFNLTAATLRIGNENTTTRWIRGRVGGFAMWDTALSDANVAIEWAASRPQTPGAILYYRLGSDGTAKVPDQSGNFANLNHGVVVGLSSNDRFPAVLFPPRYLVAP